MDVNARVTRLAVEAVTQRLTRRQVLQRGLSLGLSLSAIAWVLEACGSSSKSTATSQSGAASTGAASTTTSATAIASITNSASLPSGGTPQNGGDFNVLLDTTGYTYDFDPHSYYNVNVVLFQGPYEQLIVLKGSSDTEYAPGLAKTWGPSADGTEWTFTLNDNIKFHDGTPCDAQAVVSSFQRLMKMQLAPAFIIGRFVTNPDTDITVVDSKTVKFKLNAPNPAFEAAMASTYGVYIVSPTAVQQHKTASDPWAHDWFTKNMVGTGPYKATTATQQQVVLERFPDYWRGWQGAHFDRIILRVVEDTATRQNLIEGGGADALVHSLTPQAVEQLKQNPKVQVITYPSTQCNLDRMNTGDRLKDVNARKGFSYAFPYDQMRNGIFKGLIQRTGGPLPPTVRGYDAQQFIYDTDLNMAKQLISKQFPSGSSFTYMIASGDDLISSVAQLFQANLAQIGYTLKIQQVEASAYDTLFYGDAPPTQRPDFFGGGGWWPDYNDVYDYLYPIVDSQAGGSKGANAMFYSNAQVDKDLDSLSGWVKDDNTFNSLTKDAQTVMTVDDPPAIYWGMVTWYSVLGSKIRGYLPNPLYLYTFRYYDIYRVA
ncbi:MAG TPA: ABC transporter substrate-binding protein [Nitrolancea sp.]|jgi:peptide/nickel transport system substrate-binding protein|nr:ABC transporter substrate-binding protein [Nitrolancea sp.]